MDFALLPPEVNSGRMYTGPGAAPMLAAAASWDALAAALESAAGGYSSEISGLTGSGWSGPASDAMSAAVAPYMAWLQVTATLAEQTAAQARTAAAAYEAAFAMTVPPPVIAANRALLAALIATNFFGQNTAAIAATEAHYAEMWAQDATAMYGYAHSAAAASVLAPFSKPAPTTNAAGLSAQTGAVAQAAGVAAGAHIHALSHAASALPTTLHQSVSSLGSTNTAGSTTTSMTPTSALDGLGSALALPDIGGSVGTNTFALASGMYTVVTNSVGWAREILVAGGIAGYMTLDALGPHHALSGVGPASAGLGNAASLGGLSVPPSWAAAATQVEPVALSLSAASVSIIPASGPVAPPGLAFQEAVMGTMTGHGAVADEPSRKTGKKRSNAENNGQDETGRSAAELVSANGWLASARAHNERRRHA